MGGASGSAVTGCDVVNGGGEASDNGAAKVILSTGVEGESDALVVWINVTVRIGRRLLDLWSGNSILMGENCISHGPTTDDVALWKWWRASASTREVEDST